MIQKITVEMIQNARDEIDNAFKLNNSELSIIPKSQREARDIINYALDRLNGEIMDQAIKTNCEIAGEVYNRAFIQPLSEGEHRYVTISNGDVVKLTVDDHGELRKDGITKKCGPGEKSLFVGDPVIYQKGIQGSFKKNENGSWSPIKDVEPELNEEAISKLCDDLIEAKKEPLSAAQIIDKYARRD